MQSQINKLERTLESIDGKVDTLLVNSAVQNEKIIQLEDNQKTNKKTIWTMIISIITGFISMIYKTAVGGQ